MSTTSSGFGRFAYRAHTGADQGVSGTVDAAGPDQARATLESMGLTVTEFDGRRVERPVAVDAGAAPMSGRDLVATVEQARRRLGAGYARLIDAAAGGARAREALGALTAHVERGEQLAGRIRRAILAPVLMVAAMLAVVLGILCLVVPRAREGYDPAAALPAMTTWMLAHLGVLIAVDTLTMVVLLGGTALWWGAGRISGGRIPLERMLRWLPILGTAIGWLRQAQWCEAAALAMEWGLTLPAAAIAAAEAGQVTALAQDAAAVVSRLERGGAPGAAPGMAPGAGAGMRLDVLDQQAAAALARVHEGTDGPEALVILAGSLRGRIEGKLGLWATAMTPVLLFLLWWMVGLLGAALIFTPLRQMLESLN